MENAIAVETKFAYRHKPTGDWCYIRSYRNDDIGWGGVRMSFSEFVSLKEFK
jgi:hypothetical protein